MRAVILDVQKSFTPQPEHCIEISVADVPLFLWLLKNSPTWLFLFSNLLMNLAFQHLTNWGKNNKQYSLACYKDWMMCIHLGLVKWGCGDWAVTHHGTRQVKHSYRCPSAHPGTGREQASKTTGKSVCMSIINVTDAPCDHLRSFKLALMSLMCGCALPEPPLLAYYAINNNFLYCKYGYQ